MDVAHGNLPIPAIGLDLHTTQGNVPYKKFRWKLRKFQSVYKRAYINIRKCFVHCLNLMYKFNTLRKHSFYLRLKIQTFENFNQK